MDSGSTLLLGELLIKYPEQDWVVERQSIFPAGIRGV